MGSRNPLRDETEFNHERMILGRLVWLALLEGSRLEDRGDMPGAWTCYRAVLGMRAHVMRRGTVLERLIAELQCKGIRPRVAIWAADPKTEVLHIRRALDDVIACEPRPEWDSSSLKVDYLLAMRKLDRVQGVLTQGDDDDLAYHIGGEAWPPNLAHQAARRAQIPAARARAEPTGPSPGLRELAGPC